MVRSSEARQRDNYATAEDHCQPNLRPAGPYKIRDLSAQRISKNGDGPDRRHQVTATSACVFHDYSTTRVWREAVLKAMDSRMVDLDKNTGDSGR